MIHHPAKLIIKLNFYHIATCKRSTEIVFPVKNLKKHHIFWRTFHFMGKRNVPLAFWRRVSAYPCSCNHVNLCIQNFCVTHLWSANPQSSRTAPHHAWHLCADQNNGGRTCRPVSKAVPIHFFTIPCPSAPHVPRSAEKQLQLKQLDVVSVVIQCCISEITQLGERFQFSSNLSVESQLRKPVIQNMTMLGVV